MNKKTIALAVLFAFIGVCLFFAGRNSKTTLVADDKYQRKYDSITNINFNLELDKKHQQDTILRLKSAFKILSGVLLDNHKKVTNDKIKIKDFTPDSRNLWLDSVLRAEGLR